MILNTPREIFVFKSHAQKVETAVSVVCAKCEGKIIINASKILGILSEHILKLVKKRKLEPSKACL